MLSPLSFFQPIFYPWTFLCCCGAVFSGAVAFNGDLSAWEVGKVTTMPYSTCTLPPHSPRSSPYFWLLLFPLLLSVAALIILYLNYALSSFFFQPILILGLFFVVAVVQCFTMLVTSIVISPHGRSGKWRTCIKVRTCTLFPSSPRSGLFLWLLLIPFSFFVPA